MSAPHSNVRKFSLAPSWAKVSAPLFSLLGGSYWLFLLSIVILAVLALLAYPLFFLSVGGDLPLSDISAEGFLVQTLGFGVMVAVTGCLSAVGAAFCRAAFRLQVQIKLRKEVLWRVHRMPLHLLDLVGEENWPKKMAKNLCKVECFLTDVIPSQIRACIVLLGSALLLIVGSGFVVLFPLGIAGFLLLSRLEIKRRLALQLKKYQQLNDEVSQLLIENLEGVRTIRCYAAERYLHQRFESELKKAASSNIIISRSLGLVFKNGSFLELGIVAGSLAVLSWLFIPDTLTVSAMLIYPFCLFLFYGAGKNLVLSAASWKGHLAEVNQLCRLICGEEYPLGDWQHVFNYSDENISSESQRLVIQNLVLDRSHKQLVGPFSFEIEQGQLWVVTGAPHSGKTAFLEVLAGLRPALEGRSVLKDWRGKLLWESKATSDELKVPLGLCAYVEQRPFIFQGTVRDNLCFGNRDIFSDDLIWAALDRVGLSNMMASNGGLDHELRGSGQNLNRGQRYRLGFCRALLTKRPFLLLDEPFIFFDEHSVKNISSVLEAEKKRAGIVIATRRRCSHFSADGMVTLDSLPGSKHQKSERKIPNKGNGNGDLSMALSEAGTLM